MRGSAAAVSLVACAILLAGCGGDTATTEPEGQPSSLGATTSAQPATAAPTAAPTTSAPTTSPPPAVPGTAIMLAVSPFGDVLFDGTGQAIYLFDKEESPTPECYEGCAEAWPPVLTEGPPAAAAGVNAELLATTTRTDGATQVMYGGHPLYFYAHEGKNVVLCHDVVEFGGRWLAVTASGEGAPR